MPDPVGVGRAAQGDDILAGQVGDAYLVGGDEADGGGALQRGERGEGLAAEPDLGRAAVPSPAIARSRVLLPVPLRPMSAVIDPCGSTASASRSRTRRP